MWTPTPADCINSGTQGRALSVISSVRHVRTRSLAALHVLPMPFQWGLPAVSVHPASCRLPKAVYPMGLESPVLMGTSRQPLDVECVPRHVETAMGL